ncbi:ATP-binding protein [Streptomyces sp. NPDC059875]|uniref:ATP-binding protein n=1 Tax=unclassified Streptomyces TaxID=2593676 RepID=UPI0036659200
MTAPAGRLTQIAETAAARTHLLGSPLIGPPDGWGETFSDDDVAAAMIDRLVHHAEVLTLTGDSYNGAAHR